MNTAVDSSSNTHQGSPDDSPAERYRRGVRFLDGGMPTKARQLIDEAISGNHRVLVFSQFVKFLKLIETYGRKDRLYRAGKAV